MNRSELNWTWNLVRDNLKQFWGFSSSEGDDRIEEIIDRVKEKYGYNRSEASREYVRLELDDRISESHDREP